MIKNVLVLTSPREPDWIDRASNEVSKGLHDFIATLNADGDIKFAVSTLDKLDFSIVDGIVSIFDNYTKKDLSAYDLVHFRNVMLFPDFARAITLYMESRGRQAFEKVDVDTPEYGKLSQMILFAQNSINVPNTWATWDVRNIRSLISQKKLTLPLVIKANNGIKGRDNYLVRNNEQLDDVVTKSKGVRFVIQEFIPNDGDYRVLCFTDEAPLIFKRVAAEGSHLNNTSQGGSSYEIDVADFDQKALTMSRTAAKLMRRRLAGVDTIQDNKTGNWYVLEVNANPALSGGALLDRKVTGYKKMIEEML
ncbi:hypothetical protein BH10PAT4_BH10PAT4_5030 [soil metagenome]